MKRKVGALLLATVMLGATATTSYAAQGETTLKKQQVERLGNPEVEIAVKPEVMLEPKEKVEVLNLEDLGISIQTIDRLNENKSLQSASTLDVGTMAAGWQAIDSHRIWPLADNGSWNTTNWDYISPPTTSPDGGNIGLTVTDLGDIWQNAGYISPSKARIEVMVYEDDGSYSDDDYISTFNVYPWDGDTNKMFSVPISGYRDGVNAKAEVEFRYTWNFTSTEETTNYVFD